MGVQQPPLATKPKGPKPVSEARRIRKPLMERKRRERINTSLNDLATLLAEAHMVKTEAGKPTKLEKADILELTVKHIKTLKTQTDAEADADGEGVSPTSSYKEGFSRCMGVVEQALGKAGKEALRERLLTHLQTCLQSLQPPTPHPDADDTHLPSKDASERLSGAPVTPAVKSEGSTSREGGPRLTLVPTRLPTGGVAFLVQGGIDPSILLPQDCKVGLAKPQCRADPSSSSPSEPSVVTSTAATQCSNTSSTTSTSASLPTQCPPTSTTKPTQCQPTTTTKPTQCPPTITKPIQGQPTTTTQCSPTTTSLLTKCSPDSTSMSTQCPPVPPTSTQCSPSPIATQCPPTPPLSTQCPHTPPLSTQCPPTPPLSTQCPPTPPISTHCPPTLPISTHCPPTPPISTQCPPTPPLSTQCPPTPPEFPQCPPTPPISTQYPPTPLISTQSSSTSTLASTQYSPSSTNHCTSTSISIQYPPTSILTQCSSIATLTQHPPDPRASSDQGQRSPSVMTYYNPAHAAHIPPTPPPSVSPQTPLHHPCQLQAVYSEEEMDTDEDYEGEIEVDNQEPYDLSMRRMWRPW